MVAVGRKGTAWGGAKGGFWGRGRCRQQLSPRHRVHVGVREGGLNCVGCRSRAATSSFPARTLHTPPASPPCSAWGAHIAPSPSPPNAPSPQSHPTTRTCTNASCPRAPLPRATPSPAAGNVTTAAGTSGSKTKGGKVMDGEGAAAAFSDEIAGLACLPDGSVLVADENDQALRRVCVGACGPVKFAAAGGGGGGRYPSSGPSSGGPSPSSSSWSAGAVTLGVLCGMALGAAVTLAVLRWGASSVTYVRWRWGSGGAAYRGRPVEVGGTARGGGGPSGEGEGIGGLQNGVQCKACNAAAGRKVGNDFMCSALPSLTPCTVTHHRHVPLSPCTLHPTTARGARGAAAPAHIRGQQQWRHGGRHGQRGRRAPL